MFIFNDYFFLFFRKTVCIFVPEFYADKGQSDADRQDTPDKPQIVPHKTEVIFNLLIYNRLQKTLYFFFSL
jgi:hypothetical protein